MPITNPWIETVSGRIVDLKTPELDAISLHDIAHGLGHLCRYNGHTQRFYSVAHHSVLMTRYLVEHTMKGDLSGDMILATLLHDAAEAYIGDYPTPVKRLVPEIKALERQLQVVIFSRFNINRAYIDSPIIDALDKRIVNDERAQLMRTRFEYDWSTDYPEPLGVTIEHWTIQQVYYHFTGWFAIGQALQSRKTNFKWGDVSLPRGW